MSEIRAVLWDLDGVLVASGRFHFEAFRQLMQEHGRDLDEEEFGRLFGLRNDDILRALLGDLPDDRARELAERKEVLFRERIAGRVEALPGAIGLARRLASAGVPQAIVSSAPRANVDLILDSLALTAAFATIVAEDDVHRGKPEPEGFLTAAQRVGVDPGACVVLEDAPEGVEAARRAGMRAVGVATTRPRERLSAAELVVDRLDDASLRDLLPY